MIKIDHATFTYGENNEYSVGIRDIDLEIEDGQVIVLCGFRQSRVNLSELWENPVVEKQHSLE